MISGRIILLGSGVGTLCAVAAVKISQWLFGGLQVWEKEEVHRQLSLPLGEIAHQKKRKSRRIPVTES